MAGWNGSTRAARLPSDWPRRRARVLRRDGHRCCWVEDGQRCEHTDVTGTTLEVDHIVRGDDHHIDNLQTLCGAGSPANHHQHKTITERRPPRRRPQEQHPGAL